MHTLTIGVWCLTECEEIYYGIVHLQHGRTLSMHYRQTRPSAHRVIGQTTGQDHEGLAGTNTHKQMQKKRLPYGQYVSALCCVARNNETM